MTTTKHIPANETRFPEPRPGEALVVTKYGESKRKAVIMHPDDFDLLDRYRRIFAGHEPYEMKLTDAALAAHELGESGADESEIDLESLDRALA
ncbi:MAG: hypothetical protein R2718_04305 [Solirubrobacterales bacterium]